MSFTDDLEDEVLAARYNTGSLVFGIFTSNPTDTADLSGEVALTRQPITFSAVALGKPISNTNLLEFGPFAATTTVTFGAVFRTSDNKMVSHAPAVIGIEIPAGQFLRIPVGYITADLD